MRQVPRARLALLFVVALVASGCMGGGEKQSANAPAKFGQKAVTPKFNSGVEEALDAHPVKASKEELGGWWLVSAHATPAGALTTFRWNVPFGAEIGLRARDTRGVYLEVAPVVVNGTGPEQWCLFGFVEAEGKLRFVPSPPAQVLGNNQIVFLPPATPAYCESAVTLTNRTVSTTPGSAAPSFVVQPTYRPFHISLETTKAIANVTYWVLAAKSAAPIEFGLAFRTFPELPGRTVQPAANVDVFLSNTGGQKPYAVKTNQVDAGFGFADYSGSTQVSTTA
ncbi:MAG TPA: hypothetical protein VI818_02075, partial [Candidatus Thermoplasmatota archaeon]|nr:hypothetical protein [Candidatus Thermoplasmatota archaeon]